MATHKGHVRHYIPAGARPFPRRVDLVDVKTASVDAHCSGCAVVGERQSHINHPSLPFLTTSESEHKARRRDFAPMIPTAGRPWEGAARSPTSRPTRGRSASTTSAPPNCLFKSAARRCCRKGKRRSPLQLSARLPPPGRHQRGRRGSPDQLPGTKTLGA